VRDEIHASLACHLPGYKVTSMIELGEGLDNVSYEVNDELIVRKSKEADPASRSESIRCEAALLAAVAELSTLPIPDQGTIRTAFVTGTGGGVSAAITRRLRPQNCRWPRPRTVGYIHSTIRVALQRAVKKRLIPYNVARDAEPPPRGPKKEMPTLSLEQVTDFFKAAAAAKSRFEALFILAVLAGPRPGELLGLKWSDLVLPEQPDVAGEARIRRAVSLVCGKPHLRDTTKTGKGRPVHLLPEAVQALRAHRIRYLEERLRYAEIWNSAWRVEARHEDLVFPSMNGGPMDRDNLAARHFKPLLKRAGLPDIRLYDLRHTFATLWLESGEHPKILQEILGHSRISVTLDTYSHVIPHMQRDAMDRFGKMFAKPS
jgi:integrase